MIVVDASAFTEMLVYGQTRGERARERVPRLAVERVGLDVDAPAAALQRFR